jgi:hypothetical protein
MQRFFKLVFLMFFILPYANTSAQVTQKASTPFIQGLNYKFGKVSKKELELKAYQPDTTAKAVSLLSRCELYFDYTTGLVIRTCYHDRIKILSDEAKGLATVSRFYYKSRDDVHNQDRISKVKGYSFNLENGKIVKTKLKKNYISKEKVSNTAYELKFSLPNVKKGTVIEYTYTVTSPRYWDIPSFDFQGDIPYDKVELEATFPGCLTINTNLTGWQKVNKKVEKVRDTMLDGFATRATYTSTQVPALRKEPYIWCLENFRSTIRFNLTGIRYQDMSYKDFSNSWEKVRDYYYKSDNFGKNIKRRPLLDIEIKSENLAKMSVEEKVLLAYKMVKQKVSWNGKYRVFCDNLKEVVKKGEGSNAAINFLVMQLLRKWRIEVAPALLVTRDKGIFPCNVMEGFFNTFVLGVKKGTYYFYTDASNIYGKFNFLPLNLSVDKAVLMPPKGATQIVNLDYTKKSIYIANAKSKIDEDGLLKADMTITSMGYRARSEKAKYEKMHKDSIAFIENFEKEEEVTVLSYGPNKFMQNKTTNVTQISLEKELQTTSDRIYVNPMIIPHISKQPFKAQQRILPIEFPYTSRVMLNNMIEIPEGYEVEELPKPLVATTKGNKIRLHYKAKVLGNKIQLSYRYDLNRRFFLPKEYELIQRFFTEMVKQNNAMVVLKRKDI